MSKVTPDRRSARAATAQPFPASRPNLPPGEDVSTPAVLGQAERLSPFEREVVEVFVGLSKVLGFPKSYGEIYGVLFASPEPLRFSDIQERLYLSKGSVSQGLRALRDLGAVRVATAEDDGVGKPESAPAQTAGHKSQVSYFMPVLELRRLMSAFLQASIDPQLTQSRQNLARARELLRPDALPEVQRDLLFQRLGKLQTWHDRAKGLLPWAVRMLG